MNFLHSVHRMAVPQIAVKVVSDEPVDDEYLEDILADKLGGQSNVVSIHRESDENVIVTLKNQEGNSILEVNLLRCQENL